MGRNSDKRQATSDKIETMRHSLSHILAAAVLDMFPEAKLGIGPAIENGFYYDFDLPRTLIPEDLPILEDKMRALLSQNLKFEKAEVPITKAIAEFKKSKQTYKTELLNDLKKDKTKKVTFYKTGGFIDLCAGPHVKSTSEIDPKAFKLTSIAGAYWKGNEKNKMLQRIYGVAFANKKQLNEYLKMREEAEKRDHRKLGRELEIFHIDETVGKGLPLWLPKGAVLRQTLERFIVDEETRRGYVRTYSPVIGNVNLYKLSGHWDHYKDDMYPPIKFDKEEYVLRPMSCPHQFMVYKAKPHSYKELPLRYAELAEMYRREKSGELSGLTRVMGFTLNDAHIVCREDQLEKEFLAVLDLVQFGLKKVGLYDAVWFRASLKDKEKSKYIQDDKLWNKSEKMLVDFLKKAKVKHVIGVGDAAFYGPKADIQAKTASGKEETIITIQIDFVSAERFDMSYIDEKGAKKRPVIIHRSAIGCIERTIAFLLEHHAGALPTWLSPVQVNVITVGAGAKKYAKEVNQILLDADIRSELKDENETVGKKIREAELQKIPYMLVVGDKEVKSKSVAVRKLKDRKITSVKFDKFLKDIQKEIEEKR